PATSQPATASTNNAAAPSTTQGLTPNRQPAVPARAITELEQTSQAQPVLQPQRQLKAGASQQISAFLTAHLDTILAPLDKSVTQPRAQLLQLEGQLSSEARKSPQSDRTGYQAAFAVCTALGQVMDERDKALA